ncbi:MAG: hypothetical protein DHS20C13_22890 [Thermodesulfobacteriota bacterium]|nr:MAG: hypothetical protein DHS20C13_22890 [Thermodesulfobacteriota bacterium]
MESGDATAQEKPIIGLYSILYAAAEYLGRETVPELFNELGKYKSVLKSYVACSLDNCSLLDFSSFVSLISYICFFYQKVAFQNPSSNKIALKVKEEIGAAYKATMALPISCSSKRFKQFRFTVEETKKEIDIFLLEKVKNKHSEKKKLPIPKANVSPAEEMLVDDEDRGADKRNLYDSTLSDEQVREVPDILATARELSLAGQTFLGACDYFRAIDCYTTLVNLRNTPLFLQAEACDGLANAHRSQAEVLLGGREFFCFKEAVDAAFYVYSVSEEQVGIFYSKKSLAKHNNTIHRTVVTVVSMLRDAFEHYALAIKYFRLEKRLLGELTEEDFDREAIHSAVRYFIENCRRNLAGLNELLLRFKGWSNYHLKRRNEERKFLAGEQSASTLSAQTVETRKDSIRQLKFFAGTLDDSVSPLLESTLENSVLRRKYRVLLQQLDISAGLQTPTSCAPDVSNCNDFPLLPAALPEISRKEEQRDAVAPVVALEMDASSDAEIRKMSIQIQALIPCEIMNFVQFLQENYIVRFVGSIVWQIVAASLSPENRHYIKANDYDLYLFPLPSSPDVTIEALISSLYQYPGASDIVSSGARKLIHLKLGDYKVDISVSSEIFLRQTIINNQRKRLITANSLFLDPKGVVEDAVGGIEDILYRRLRLVFSDVAQRYADDPLKMPRVIGDVVRAVFCEKPYQMADNLIKDIKDNAYHLTENLSLQPEKRGVFLATLKRYFSGFNAVYYYDYFFTSGLLSVFFPGITQLSLKQPAFFFVYNNMVRARLSLYNNLDVPVLPSFDSTLAYLVLPNILLSADATVGNWSTHPYINAHLRERWGVIEPLLRMADEEFEQWWSFYFCDHNSDFYQQESGIEVPPAVVESNLIGINPRM